MRWWFYSSGNQARLNHAQYKRTPQPRGILRVKIMGFCMKNWEEHELQSTFMMYQGGAERIWAKSKVGFSVDVSSTCAGVGLGWRLGRDLHRETFYLSLSGLSSVTVEVMEQEDRQIQMSSWISQDMMIFGDLTLGLFTTQTQDDFATRETAELSVFLAEKC